MSGVRYTYYYNSNGGWFIVDRRGKIVFRMRTDKKSWWKMPQEFKAKYEELCGRPEFIEFDESAACGTTENLVEIMASDSATFNQPCKFGHHVPDHAVYCHNEGWLYAPRKCHRTWHSGGKERDEDCPGFKPNPNYKPLPEPPKE